MRLTRKDNRLSVQCRTASTVAIAERAVPSDVDALPSAVGANSGSWIRAGSAEPSEVSMRKFPRVTTAAGYHARWRSAHMGTVRKNNGADSPADAPRLAAGEWRARQQAGLAQQTTRTASGCSHEYPR